MQELQEHVCWKGEEAKHSIETGVPVEGQPNVNSLRLTGNRWQLASGIFLESMVVYL